MNKIQRAYSLGMKYANRRIKEDGIVDSSVQESQSILQEMKDKFQKLDDLCNQALALAADIDQDYLAIEDIRKQETDRNSPMSVFWGSMYDAIGYYLHSGENWWTIRLKELVTDYPKVVAGFEKLLK